MKSVVINDEEFTIYLEESTIQARINELSEELSIDYSGKNPLFIGVLSGACFFFTDLIKQMNIPLEIDFVKFSSYGDGMKSSGKLTELIPLTKDISERHVVLVEDIVDSGHTANLLTEKLLTLSPRSLSIVTLLQRSQTSVPSSVKYIGFFVSSGFLVGYGLDYAQKGRALRSIYNQ